MTRRAVLTRVSIAMPAVIGLFGALACGKGAPAGPASAPGSSTDLEMAEPEGPVAPMTPREAALWAAAAGEDAEGRMRLVDLVGCEGLQERASQAEFRPTAIRAMRHCGDFSVLPWLARVATQGSDAEARAALEAVDDLAARPRRATDPEDADELHAGCVGLLSLARATGMPRERRVWAIRGLRMLSEQGCVKRSDIPKDLDPG